METGPWRCTGFIFIWLKVKLRETNREVRMQQDSLVREWKESLTPREKELHAFAEVQLKAEKGEKGDSGSYFPEKSRAFLVWLKKRKEAKV